MDKELSDYEKMGIDLNQFIRNSSSIVGWKCGLKARCTICFHRWFKDYIPVIVIFTHWRLTASSLKVCVVIIFFLAVFTLDAICVMVTNSHSGQGPLLWHEIILSGRMARFPPSYTLRESCLKECFKDMQRHKWISTLNDCTKYGRHSDAFFLFIHKARSLSCFGLDHQVFATILKSCAALRTTDFGRVVHGCFVELGHFNCHTLSKALLNMYAKSGAFPDCQKLFRQMPKSDPVVWNIVLSGLSGYREYDDHVLDLFNSMRLSDESKPNPVTVTIALPVNQDAYAAFCSIGDKDVVSWNAIIAVLTTSSLKVCVVIIVFATVFTLAAICVMVTNSQSIVLLDFTIKARYSDSSSMRFLLVVAAIVCAFSVVSVFFVYRLKRPRTDLKYSFYLLLHDMVIAGLSLLGCAAATAVGYISRYGEEKMGWMAVCNHLENFCNKMMIPWCCLTWLASPILLLLLCLSTNSCFSMESSSTQCSCFPN